MTVIDRELEAHVHSFGTFRQMVVFAALHIALTLACLALAFVGHALLFAFLLWLGGSLVLVVGVMLHSGTAANRSADSIANFKQKV